MIGSSDLARLISENRNIGTLLHFLANSPDTSYTCHRATLRNIQEHSRTFNLIKDLTIMRTPKWLKTYRLDELKDIKAYAKAQKAKAARRLKIETNYAAAIVRVRLRLKKAAAHMREIRKSQKTP